MWIPVLAVLVSILLGTFILVSRDSKSGRRKDDHSIAKHDKGSNVYSKAEISLHNKRTDCWIIIKDKKNTLVGMPFLHMLEMIQLKAFMGLNMQLEFST
ncbi:cytochrome B5-like protein isoform X2 [Cannabis sativa]|uniref:cytochrome B5-like protein isoform X2 n=1 Tax=Cannabis sativa TaxID=3483 RepID=UPI0029C9C4CC|nr:cytochrome B5-like protein isoform X2 [Cannabis sativa]